jgi:hypothetical protein
MLAMLVLRVRNKKCGPGSGKCAAWTVTRVLKLIKDMGRRAGVPEP